MTSTNSGTATTPTLSVPQLAKVCHEANRAYCEGLGDTSQAPWSEAPEWQRNSAVLGVEFHLANPDAPASASHESWLEQKRKEGWAYGPVKDPERKLHPCFIPFEGLPLHQQMKDFLFTAIVNALRPVFAETPEQT